jgi:hypothetical protein
VKRLSQSDQGSNKIVNVANPTNPQDAATKNYVDNSVPPVVPYANLTDVPMKQPAFYVANDNETLSGLTPNFGGIEADRRVLVRGQTDPSENGIYVSSAGAWSRSADANHEDEMPIGFFIKSLSNDRLYFLSAAEGFVLGTDPIAFPEYAEQIWVTLDAVDVGGDHINITAPDGTGGNIDLIAGNGTGTVGIAGGSDSIAHLDTGDLTTDRNFSFPDESGTLATQEYVGTIPLNDFTIPDDDLNLNAKKIANLADPTDDQDAATKAYVDAVADAVPSGSSTEFSVTQTAHGLSVGDVVKNSGSANTYAKAQADSAANAEVVGIITEVPDANSLVITTQGVITTGVPAVAAGTVLFLSASSAGALTATEPSTDGQVSKPLAVVLQNGTRMAFYNYRGEVINSEPGGGGSGAIAVSELDGTPTVSDVTEIIVTNGTLIDNEDGTVTIDTGGTGDVDGPGSSTDNGIPRFDGTTGKLLQTSGLSITDSNILSGLTDPSASDDAATKGYVDAEIATGVATRQSKVYVTVGQDAGNDYVTDGTADEVQINQAFSDLTSDGGEIILVDKTYSIAAPIVATNYVNLTARNKGWFSSTSMITAASGFTGDDMLQIFCAYPGVLRDVAFNGDNIAANGITIGLSGATVKGLKWFNVFVQKCTGYGVRGNPAATGKPQPYCWDDSHFWNLQLRLNGTGLELNTSQTSLHGTLIAGNTTGVEVLSSSTLDVYGGTFSSNGTDILVTGDNFFGPLGFFGTWFEGATAAVITRSGTPTFTETGGINFIGCHLFNATTSTAFDFTNIHGSVVFDNPVLTSGAGTNKTIQLGSDSGSGRATVVHIRGRNNGINFTIAADANNLGKVYYDDELRGNVASLLTAKTLAGGDLFRFDADSKNFRFANNTNIRMYSDSYSTQKILLNASTGKITSVGADMSSAAINNVANPTNDQDAATKSYVDAVAQGLDSKDSCRVATTTAGTLASSFENGDTVDGVTLATGDRILIKNQATGSENGIYTLNASGAPTRAIDADTSGEVTTGMFTFITEGTTNANTGWVLTTSGTITLGTTALAFSQFSAVSDIQAGNGLTKTGTVLDVVGTTDRITVGADSVDIASTYAGQTSITTLGTITTGDWNGSAIPVANGGTGATTASGARTNLGLGSIATQAASSVAITGGSINGITDLAIADGGTGASSATVAFDNLAPTTTQGDLIYHNGTDNVRLPKGTAFQWLRMNSGATAPEWASISTPQTVKLAADQTVATTTLTDVTGMSFTISANTDYFFEFYLVHQSAAQTTGLKIAAATATATVNYIVYQTEVQSANTANGTDNVQVQNHIASASAHTAAAQYAATTNNMAVVKGVVSVSGTGGTLKLQFAGDAAANITAKKGSYGRMWQ